MLIFLINIKLDYYRYVDDILIVPENNTLCDGIILQKSFVK
jgi:hypothetical protein